MINYQLYRTNIFLGGQMKYDLIVDSNGQDLIVNDFHITPISKLAPYNKYIKEELINYSHSENIKKFYKKCSSSFYNTWEDQLLTSLHPIISDDVTPIYNDELEMGCRRSNFKLYGKQFSFFCPLWLEKVGEKDCINFQFEIYANKSSKIPFCTKNLKLTKVNNAIYHNKFVDYINDYFRYIGINKGNEDLINIDPKNNIASVTGLNVSSGLNNTIQIPHILDNLFYREIPLLEFDNYIINSYQDNKLICKQLFNFNICFNIDDIIPPILYDMVLGDRINIKIKVGINDEVLEIRDFYSNYEFIPKKLCGSKKLSINKNDIKENPLPNPQGEEFNVLSFLKDYNYISYMDKNKITQSICHWSLFDNNDYIFNAYEGFAGYYIDDRGKYKFLSHIYDQTPNVNLYNHIQSQNTLTWCNVVEFDRDVNLQHKHLNQLSKYCSVFKDNSWVNGLKYEKSDEITIHVDKEDEDDYIEVNPYTKYTVSAIDPIYNIGAGISGLSVYLQNEKETHFIGETGGNGKLVFWWQDVEGLLSGEDHLYIEFKDNPQLNDIYKTKFVYNKTDYIFNIYTICNKYNVEGFIKSNQSAFDFIPSSQNCKLYYIPDPYIQNIYNSSIISYEDYEKIISDEANLIKYKPEELPKYSFSSTIQKNPYLLCTIKSQADLNIIESWGWPIVKNEDGSEYIAYSIIKLPVFSLISNVRIDIYGQNDIGSNVIVEKESMEEDTTTPEVVGEPVVLSIKKPYKLKVSNNNDSDIQYVNLLLINVKPPYLLTLACDNYDIEYKGKNHKIIFYNSQNNNINDTIFLLTNNVELFTYKATVEFLSIVSKGDYIHDDNDKKLLEFLYDLLSTNKAWKSQLTISPSTSLHITKADSPSLSSTEVDYYKNDQSGVYVQRYFGKIKPTFIKVGDDINFNYKYYKQPIKPIEYYNCVEYRKYINTGYQPLYPSIGFYLIKRKDEDYTSDIFKESKVEYNNFNNNYILALRPEFDVLLESEKDDDGNYKKIKDLVKGYLKEYYNCNDNELDYIYSLYEYTSSFDYKSDTDIDNYIYKVKITMK